MRFKNLKLVNLKRTNKSKFQTFDEQKKDVALSTANVAARLTMSGKTMLMDLIVLIVHKMARHSA